MPFKERRAHLEGFNFNCTCSLCTASEAERTLSDKRRYRLRDILSELPTYKGEAAILGPVLEEVLDMVKKEDMWFLVGNFYAGFAWGYLGSGDFDNATKCGFMAEQMAERYRQEEGVSQIMRDFWQVLKSKTASIA